MDRKSKDQIFLRCIIERACECTEHATICPSGGIEFTLKDGRIFWLPDDHPATLPYLAELLVTEQLAAFSPEYTASLNEIVSLDTACLEEIEAVAFAPALHRVCAALVTNGKADMREIGLVLDLP